MEPPNRLELLRNKEKEAQSAIASQEVREHLAGFLRSKRQGSQSQMSPAAAQSQQQQQQPQVNSISSNNNHNNNSNSFFVNNLISNGLRTDGGEPSDHPLRKTASMPTMHIPYKAQSLSRRRQMERRTTMSPLMKRKLKPKRQLLRNSQDSNSAEYSSNPCILHAARSHSQSSSSPPPPPLPPTNHQSATLSGGNQQLRQANSQQRQTSSGGGGGGIQLSSIYSNRELENLQNSNSLYTSNSNSNNNNFSSACPHSSSASSIQTAASTASASRCVAGSPSSLDSQLRQQQHLRANEALRKTVAQRAGGRCLLASGLGGGSLDNEGAESAGSQDSSQAASLPLPLEHRQWSLDGATGELRAQQQALSKTVTSSGNLFQREIHRRRLATTSDAAILRRSQSPSSSISMGLTGGQAAASVSSQQQQQSQAGVPPGSGRPPTAHHAKHLSSSSSSTSSLLSQQDSFEESSSQAIDLSSSSERHRQLTVGASSSHHYGANFNSNQGHSVAQQQQHPLARCHSSQQQQQQRGLQESFRQLQLCQAAGRNFQGHAPNLLLANKAATSLEAPQCAQQQQQQQQQAAPVPLAEQFNLSSSAQNLIPAQDLYQQQQQLGPSGAELNQWLLAYRAQMGGKLSEEQQVNNALLAKLAQSDFCRQLPEPYKSNFLAQLLQQQQQLHQMRCEAPPLATSEAPTTNPLDALNSRQQHHHQHFHYQHQSQLQQFLGGREQPDPRCFARTLSSPLLQVGQQEPQQRSRRSANKASERMVVDDDDEEEQRQQPLAAPDRRVRHRRPDDKQSASCAGHQQAKFHYVSRQQQQQSVPCSFIYNPQFNDRSSTGLTYELAMCNHKCICSQPEANHPENSLRILAIWRRLYDRGLMARCARIEARQAEQEELQLCHSETYACYFGKTPGERVKLPRLDLSKLAIEGLTQLECGGQGADIDTAWNEEQTPGAARLAAGCVIEAASRVAAGKLMNAFAVVRPPGHHAEFQQAMGFCFFNSLAIAARLLISKHQLARVLIVDWDVHHGNGIQKLFYDEPRVMYISLHRHDKGNFFPGTGDVCETGAGAGEGHNWNIAWSGEAMGDAEYLAAFRSLVMPVARDFGPSMVLVACGFDAARGHPFNFGGYDLSPACFGHMTRQLMTLANGRLVLSLEGGYQLNSICDCAEACVRALLNVSPAEHPMDQISERELRREPNPSAVELLLQVSQLAAKFWPSVERWRPSIEQSALEAASVVRDMIK